MFFFSRVEGGDLKTVLGGGSNIFGIFTPTWGDDPI